MAQQALYLNSVFLLLLGFLPGCERPNGNGYVNLTNADLKQKNGILYLEEKPLTGTVYSLYPGTKDTASVSVYHQGREDGKWRKYYANGQLKEERTYHNGKKTGVYAAWWDNARKQLEYHFDNDEYDGTCREWNYEGQLIKEMHYEKGHEQGAQKMYYDNGKVRANYMIIDGKRYGLLGTKNCVNVTDSVFKN